jgi:hypothetical protein
MKTLTESIYDELMAAAKEPAGLSAVLKKHSHSKGPLYIALAQATNSIIEQYNHISNQLQQAETDHEQRQQEMKLAEQKLVDLNISTKKKAGEQAALEEKVKQSKEIVDRVKALAGLGFGLEELTKLKAVLVDIKSNGGDAPEEAVKSFFEKLANYQKLVNLEIECQAAEVKAGQAQAQAGQWEEQSKLAEVKSKVRQTSINITEKWLAQGVKEKDLPQWHKILAKSGIAPEELAEKLEKMVSLEEHLHNLETIIEKLGSQQGVLEAQVKTLNQQRQRIGGAIKDIKEKGLAEIASITESTVKHLTSQSQASISQIEVTGQSAADEIEGLSGLAKAKINSLMEKVTEYIALQREAGVLAAELVLARAIRTQGVEFWKHLPGRVIWELLRGILIRSRANSRRMQVSSKPPGSLESKICIYSYQDIYLDEILRWCLTDIPALEIEEPPGTPGLIRLIPGEGSKKP